MMTSGGSGGATLKRARGPSTQICMAVKRPSLDKSTEAAKPRVHLGSIRMDFQDTHQVYCTEESRMFCYAKCAVLKKMVSKMLNGTSAVAITVSHPQGPQKLGGVASACGG